MEMLRADKNVEELLNSIKELMSIPDEKLNENIFLKYNFIIFPS